VTVHDARYTKRFELTPDLFSLTSSTASAASAGGPAQTIPLRLNIDIIAQQSLRVENNLARLVSSADLKLQGTFDKPILYGRADIDSGDLILEGNRLIVTRGTIGFSNPTKIEPYFDIEAETRLRVPGETYRVTIGVSGTTSHAALQLDSDPPLSQVDIVSLLLRSQTTNPQDSELRGLNPAAAGRAESDLLKAVGARLLTNSISAPVGQLFEQTLGIDFQIAPSLGSETDPLTPTARVVLGRRLSNRAYLTYSRALGTANRDQIMVLEYDQNDRVGWVLTQNNDRTFAFEFRVRHVF
jgi:autotransporter translocation and assembly factor TamB